MEKLSLKAARVNAKLTQAEAAEKMGISINRVKAWECQRTLPKVTDIPDIEKTYGIDYKDLDFFK